jgi:hypothetical protein
MRVPKPNTSCAREMSDSGAAYMGSGGNCCTAVDTYNHVIPSEQPKPWQSTTSTYQSGIGEIDGSTQIQKNAVSGSVHSDIGHTQITVHDTCHMIMSEKSETTARKTYRNCEAEQDLRTGLDKVANVERWTCLRFEGFRPVRR